MDAIDRPVLEIDGAQGEGGGQVLRTSLALSAITGTPFRIHNIRAKRRKAGLLRQHLAGVRAVAEICGANVEGDALGSTSLRFVPGITTAGDHTFTVGSAGSAGLVLQAVLPPLWLAEGPSVLTVTGGTHNPTSPPAPFLTNSLFPTLARLGMHVELSVDQMGFYPAGGGRYTVRVAGRAASPPVEPFVLVDRGPIRSIKVEAIVANLPLHIGHRELDGVRRALNLAKTDVSLVTPRSEGPGNALVLTATTDTVTAVFTSFGERGVSAEAISQRLVSDFLAWEAAGVPVESHLADQLLLPLALAARGSGLHARFRTLTPTLHTITNAQVIRQFLDVGITLRTDTPSVTEVEVTP